MKVTSDAQELHKCRMHMTAGVLARAYFAPKASIVLS